MKLGAGIEPRTPFSRTSSIADVRLNNNKIFRNSASER